MVTLEASIVWKEGVCRNVKGSWACVGGAEEGEGARGARWVTQLCSTGVLGGADFPFIPTLGWGREAVLA